MYVFELASYLVVAILFGIGVGWLIWGDEPFEAAPAPEGDVDPEAIADLSSQIETRDQEIVRLRKRLKRMHADLDARDLQLTESKAQAEDARVTFLAREQELLTVSGGTDSDRSDLHVRRIAELEEQLAASRSESDGLARKLQDSMLDAQPESDGREAREALETLQHRFDDLTARHDAAAEARDTALEAHRSLSESFDQLSAAHAEAERSHSAVSNDLAEAQARLEEAVAGSDLAGHDRVRVLESDVLRLSADNHAHAARVEELEGLLSAAQTNIATLEASSAGSPAGSVAPDVEAELAKVHAELARSRQNVATLRQRLQDVEDENESLAGELARSTTELQSKSARNADAAAERDQLVARHHELEGQVQAGNAERDGLNDAVRDLQSQLSSIQAERSSRDEREQGARSELERTRTELDEIRAAFNATSADLHSTQAELQSTRAELDTSRASLGSTNEAFELERNQLRSDLADARHQGQAVLKELNELSDEFVAFRDATIRQQTSMNSLADRLARANTTLGARPAEDADQSVHPTAE